MSGHAFDPSSGVLPEALDPAHFLRTGEGSVTLLIATPLAEEGGWAPSSAVEIARSWGDAGHRIFLADLSLLRPVLHEVLQDEAGRGMGEVLSGEATLDKVVHLAKAGSFLFAGAGEGVEDAEVALSSDAWSEVLGGLAEAEASALLYVPSDIPGLASLSAHATQVIALTGAAETLRALPPVFADRVEAVIHPSFEALDFEHLGSSGEADSGLGGAGGFVEVVRDESTEALFGEPQFADLHHLPGEDAPESEIIRSDEEVHLPHPEADAESESGHPPEGVFFEFDEDPVKPPSEPDLGPGSEVGAEMDPVPDPGVDRESVVESETSRDGPGSDEGGVDSGPDIGAGDTEPESDPGEDAKAAPQPQQPPMEIVGGAVGTTPGTDPGGGGPRVALAILATVVVAFLAWYGLRGGSVEAPTPIDPVAEVPQEPEVTAPSGPVGPAAAYSWAMGAFSTAVTARSLAASFARQAPGVQFIVVPLDVNGSTFYRVLADPAEDPVAAQELRETLVAALPSLDSSAWILRETLQAFDLGDFPTYTEAQTRITEVGALGVDAYALELDGASGPVFRVYAGAFADAAQARVMAGVIQAGGLGDAQLQARSGRSPSVASR